MMRSLKTRQRSLARAIAGATMCAGAVLIGLGLARVDRSAAFDTKVDQPAAQKDVDTGIEAFKITPIATAVASTAKPASMVVPPLPQGSAPQASRSDASPSPDVRRSDRAGDASKPGPDQASGSDSHAGWLDCLIQAREVIAVASPVGGVLEKVEVERGDAVKKGQVIARLASDVEKASLELARTRAAHEAEVQAALRSKQYATREFQRASELAENQFVANSSLDRARTELELAQTRYKQANERRQLFDKEFELAKAQFDQRVIRSPIDGVVIERFHAAGEAVDERPIIRIASVNTLRVDVIVPAQAFGQVKRGSTAAVLPEIKGATRRTATVSLVDRVVDPASNTFRVRLELPNADLALPAGLRCRVDLGLKLLDQQAAMGSKLR